MLQFVLVFGHPVVTGFPAGDQRLVDEAVERGGSSSCEFHDRFPAGFLVAGQEQTIQRQRIYVRWVASFSMRQPRIRASMG